jgi:hypothetical protein
VATAKIQIVSLPEPGLTELKIKTWFGFFALHESRMLE